MLLLCDDGHVEVWRAYLPPAWPGLNDITGQKHLQLPPLHVFGSDLHLLLKHLAADRLTVHFKHATEMELQIRHSISIL